MKHVPNDIKVLIGGAILPVVLGAAGGYMAGIVTGAFVLMGGGLWLVFRTCLGMPRDLRHHFLTALTWTLVTVITTCLLIFARGNLVLHMVLIVAGLAWGPSCRQFRTRHAKAETVSARPVFLPRLFLQTLWGPASLWALTAVICSVGQVPFQRAVEQGDLATAFLLRDSGLGDPAYILKSKYGPRPLNQAVWDGDADTVAKYLAVGKVEGYPLDFALSLAVRGRNSMVTEVILSYGASPNGGSSFSREYSETPLYRAADAGKANQVRTLLRHGADPTKKGAKNTTPYEIARFKDNREVMALLASRKVQ